MICNGLICDMSDIFNERSSCVLTLNLPFSRII